MGLDMYLRASIYVSGYEHDSDEERERFQSIAKSVGLDGLVADGTPSGSVEITCVYWRKANAIHRWFVENVQEGEDDCGRYYVGTKQITELRDLCKQVLDTAQIEDGQPVVSGWHAGPDTEGEWVPNIVTGRAVTNGEELSELLPTRGGFFFGGTGYDEWYIRDLEHTVTALTRVIQNLDGAKAKYGVSLYYESSW